MTDTVRIVNRIDQLDGPDLSGDGRVQDWLADIMSLHYGVLMYRNRGEDGEIAPQIIARGELLRELVETRPELEELVAARIDGNTRFQSLLRNPEEIEKHLEATQSLINRMCEAVTRHEFISGPRYSLADSFATAALARFNIHNFSDWWAGTALEEYYTAMKARPSFVAAQVMESGTERDL